MLPVSTAGQFTFTAFISNCDLVHSDRSEFEPAERRNAGQHCTFNASEFDANQAQIHGVFCWPYHSKCPY